jgi:Tfp pilus assembly protein PilF
LAGQVDRKEEAEVEFRKTLEHIHFNTENEARVKTSLAKFYSATGQTDKAAATFREALNLNGKDLDLLVSYAWALYKANRKEEAEVEFLKALERIYTTADKVRVKTSLAKFYSATGQTDKAAATFREVLNLVPLGFGTYRG